MSKVELTEKLDFNKRWTHYRDVNGIEYWREFDANGNLIHYRNSNGYEVWHEYDAYGMPVHLWDSDGNDFWYWEGIETIDPIEILLLQKRLRDKVKSS